MLLQAKDRPGFQALIGTGWPRRTHGLDVVRDNDWLFDEFTRLMDQLYTAPSGDLIGLRRGRVLEVVASTVVLDKYPGNPAHLKAEGDVLVFVDNVAQSVPGAQRLDVCVWANCVEMGEFYDCKASKSALDSPELHLLLLLDRVLHDPVRGNRPRIGIISYDHARVIKRRIRELTDRAELIDAFGPNDVFAGLRQRRVCVCR
jgi:hypothetical protein